MSRCGGYKQDFKPQAFHPIRVEVVKNKKEAIKMKNFFEGYDTSTIEALKKAYKRLCKQYHPDNGGSTLDMQMLNAQYDELFKRVKNVHISSDGTTYEKETTEQSNEFRTIIEKIICFDMDIEIIGAWIWCFNCYQYKDELKKLGFTYASRKKAWIWHSKNDVSTNKHRMTLDEIKSLHGCESVKQRNEKRLLHA